MQLSRRDWDGFEHKWIPGSYFGWVRDASSQGALLGLGGRRYSYDEMRADGWLIGSERGQHVGF